MRWLVDAWWKLVFWWKRRTGFVSLYPIAAVGVVMSLRSSKDGDALINLDLDDDSKCFTPHVGDPGKWGTLHCELAPWTRGEVREQYARLKAGDRVRVSGAWGFDGVHVLPAGWPWWTFPLEVLLALFRHQPNFRDGWFEIHPVTSIDILES